MSVARIAALRKRVKGENLDGMVINHPDYVRYLSGFAGTGVMDGLLVLAPRSTELLTDSRYAIQAGQQVKGARVTTVKGGLIAALKGRKGINGKNIRYGYDPETVTGAVKDRLAEALPKVLLVPAGDIVNSLGWVKDKEEISSITRAAEISDTVFERILNLVTPGVREIELAAELEYQMMMLGSEKPAFETIVASGNRSAMPHALASKKKVKKGDFVTFDFGATVNGYVSDMTRTIVVGKATVRQKKVYGIVRRAQAAGVRKVRAGIEAKKVDAACRRIITRAGYGKKFGHGTGHGIGFYIHVGPSLSPLSEDKLMVNNVVTIEPGIYISGWGGVRIEDDVVVTRTGCRVLNKATKNLLEL